MVYTIARIHGELLKLGFVLSETTVSRWLRRIPRTPDSAKRWLTFLRNHREAIAAMDFFTVREGNTTRFAFVRNGGSEAVSAVDLAMRQCEVTETTSITVLTDGDAGLRSVQQQVGRESEHVLDWFHIAMRFTNLSSSRKVSMLSRTAGFAAMP